MGLGSYIAREWADTHGVSPSLFRVRATMARVEAGASRLAEILGARPLREDLRGLRRLRSTPHVGRVVTGPAAWVQAGAADYIAAPAPPYHMIFIAWRRPWVIRGIRSALYRAAPITTLALGEGVVRHMVPDAALRPWQGPHVHIGQQCLGDWGGLVMELCSDIQMHCEHRIDRLDLARPEVGALVTRAVEAIYEASVRWDQGRGYVASERRHARHVRQLRARAARIGRMADGAGPLTIEEDQARRAARKARAANED